MKKFIIKMNIKKKQKGSTTVEASLIFPLIMFIMLGIIYLTIVHFHNNVMIAESIRAMNRVGAYWQYIDMDIEGGKAYNPNDSAPFNEELPADGIINSTMIEKRNPYRSIVDLVKGVVSKINNEAIGSKKHIAKDYVNARQKIIKFDKFIEKNDDAESIDGAGFIFFGDDLKVKLGKQYINPLQGLSEAFFGKNNVMDELRKKEIEVSSVISNQVEFIRNIDTIFDLGSDIYNILK